MLSSTTEDKISDPLLDSQEITKKTYLAENFFNKVFFIWVSKLIQVAKKHIFHQNMHYQLRNEESSLENFRLLRKSYNLVRSASKRPLIKPLYQTCKIEFWISMVIAVIAGILQMSTPFMVKLFIDFMEEKSVNINRGVILLLTIFGLRFISNMFVCHVYFDFDILGFKVSNSVIAMIYDKSLKFSLMKSKSRTLGSITNHIQVDAQTLFTVSLVIAGAAVFPLQLIIGIIILSTQVGMSFLSGFAVMVLGTVINAFLGKRYQDIQEDTMKQKDERLKVSTETFNSIKYLKMSGLQDLFTQKILRVRNIELMLIKKQYKLL